MQRFLLNRLAIAAVILGFPLMTLAGEIGIPYGGGSSLEWKVTAESYEIITLRVLDPHGEVYEESFKFGTNPNFGIAELTEVVDGQYTYELVLIPNVSTELEKRLIELRAAGEDAPARRLMREAGLSNTVVQSGAFTVSRGSILDPNLQEDGDKASSPATDSNTAGEGGAATAGRPGRIAVNDQVIPDDLIVQGSACVGFDCVNGESFSFDTIRLKENNLRIHFDDTSTLAGFPNRDWRIIANDSASGGLNKFSIEDSTGARTPMTIEAAASTNSLYVDSTGRIGFRTATPVLDLHINTSNTPGIRLEQNNTGGFTAQTWDIAGNEANFFVRDVTGGSRLPLRIRPGAPTSAIDIAADGQVGIRTASPNFDLDVRGDASATGDQRIAVGADSINGPAMVMGHGGGAFGQGVSFIHARDNAGAVAPNPSLRLMTDETVRLLLDNEGFIGLGDIAAAGTNPTSPIHYTNGAVTARLTTAGVWQDNSSRAAKEHIEELEAETAFNALRDLKPVTYNYKVLPSDPKVGFIAEDVPEIVASPERDGLSALDIVAVVTKVVQEQQKTIEQLNERIAQLEAERAQQQ